MGFFVTMNRCNQFVAASNPVRMTTYLARIGAVWLSVMIFGVPGYFWGGFILEEEVMFQALLLLLLFGSRIGCHPFKHGALSVVLLYWVMIYSCASIGSSLFMAFKSEMIIPVWQAYLYVFLPVMGWMYFLRLWMTLILCQRYITGKNKLRDIDKAMKMKKKEIFKKIPVPEIALIIAGMVLSYYLKYYLAYYGMNEWVVSMISLFSMAMMSNLAMCRFIFHYGKYLKSTGRI